MYQKSGVIFPRTHLELGLPVVTPQNNSNSRSSYYKLAGPNPGCLRPYTAADYKTFWILHVCLFVFVCLFCCLLAVL